MTVVIVVARPSVMIGDMVERYREGVRSICTFILESFLLDLTRSPRFDSLS